MSNLIGARRAFPNDMTVPVIISGTPVKRNWLTLDFTGMGSVKFKESGLLPVDRAIH